MKSEYQSRASSFGSVAKVMALLVKVDYGVERFATFLQRNVTYKTLLQTIQKNCSALAHLGLSDFAIKTKTGIL